LLTVNTTDTTCTMYGACWTDTGLIYENQWPESGCFYILPEVELNSYVLYYYQRCLPTLKVISAILAADVHRVAMENAGNNSVKS